MIDHPHEEAASRTLFSAFWGWQCIFFTLTPVYFVLCYKKTPQTVNTISKSNLGGEGFLDFCVWTIVHHGKNPGQERKQESGGWSWSMRHVGHWKFVCTSWYNTAHGSCSVCFCKQHPRTICPGWHWPRWAKPSHTNNYSRKWIRLLTSRMMETVFQLALSLSRWLSNWQKLDTTAPKSLWSSWWHSMHSHSLGFAS